MFTPDGSFVDWNETFTAVTGYTDEELSTLNPTDLGAGAQRSEITEALEAVTEDLTILRFSTVLETKTGNKIPSEFQWNPFGTDGDTEKTVTAIGREITDKYKLFEERQTMTAGSQNLTVFLHRDRWVALRSTDGR